MQNESPSTTRVGLKYGFYTAIACLVVGIMFSLVLQGGDSGLNIFILSAGVAYGMLEFRRGNYDVLSYGQAFNLGMIVSVVSGLCLGLLSAISAFLLTQKELAKVKDMYMHQLETQGYGEKELEAVKPMLNFFFSPTGAFLGTVFVWALLGLVITALLGLFMRRKA